MFTGLVTDVGRVERVEDRNGLRRFRVNATYAVDAIELGAMQYRQGVIYQQGTGRVEGQVALQMLPECLGFLGMAIVVAGDDLIEIAVDAGTLHL